MIRCAAGAVKGLLITTTAGALMPRSTACELSPSTVGPSRLGETGNDSGDSNSAGTPSPPITGTPRDARYAVSACSLLADSQPTMASTPDPISRSEHWWPRVGSKAESQSTRRRR